MKRALALSLLLPLAASALAQKADEPLGIRVRIAYGFSSKFRAGGESRSIQGPEIGLALPVGTAFGQDLLLEPSYFGGGRLRHGSDDDADIYRLTLFAHRTLAKGLGVRAGIGYGSAARARSGQFDGTNGLIFDLGTEVPFRLKQLNSIATYVDVHGILSSEKELSGFFVGVGARL